VLFGHPITDLQALITGQRSIRRYGAASSLRPSSTDCPDC